MKNSDIFIYHRITGIIVVVVYVRMGISIFAMLRFVIHLILITASPSPSLTPHHSILSTSTFKEVTATVAYHTYGIYSVFFSSQKIFLLFLKKKKVIKGLCLVVKNHQHLNK